jgi:SAM-dependent methyltransferase
VTGIVLAVGVLVGLAVNGLRLRARVPPVLPAPPAANAPADAEGWAWITSRGTAVDEATSQAAIAYACASGLEMVDLVPTDLSATAARDLIRAVDSRAYRSDRLAPGRSAGAAVLVARPLLRRAGISAPGQPGGDGPDPADVTDAIRVIRPCAGLAAAIVVAPRLRSPACALSRRGAWLRANAIIVPVHCALDAIPYALTLAALLAAWPWGLAAAAGYCLQPYLIFGGTAVRSRDRHAASLLRALHTPYVWLRTAAGRWRSAAELRRDAQLAAAAPWYRVALAAGTGQFLDRRRADCPWCGSADLTPLVRSPDLVLHKPGMFTLDRCQACGHVFQNPRLTPEGLDFYYRDAYDGLGAAAAETVFLTAGESYRGRALMLAPFTTPKTWLDVGAGHGHFCAAARQVWPDTLFDGLDQGAGIEEAQRRGWVSAGYRGTFPALASKLASYYDVVSMHHYLEHTRDPFAELEAAARVLPSGGYLLIEVPDPEWPLARLLRRYWMAWFQPQHQHMMPLGNLTRALAECGLRTVAVERGQAHQASDLATASFLFFSRLARDRALPWIARPRVPPAASAWRYLVWAVGLPSMAVGVLLDHTLVRALARRWDRGNAYRVLARREDFGDAY